MMKTDEVDSMPYIGVNVSKTLTQQQKDAIKSGLGERISIIPGKSEAALMVDISDGHTMYLAGEQRELAYLDVKCYGSTEMQYKKAFTEAAFALIEQVVGLTEKDIYLTHTDFANWGTRGSMK